MRKLLFTLATLGVAVAACGSRPASTSEVVIPSAAPAPPLAPVATKKPRAADGPAVTKLVSGTRHSCVLLEDGRVACWGANIGPVVDGYYTNVLKPTIVPHVQDAVDVAAGDHHVCAVRRGGQVVCWLGHQEFPGVTDDVLLKGGSVTIAEIADAVEIASGNDHVCVRRRDGRVACFGSNNSGEIGAPAGKSAGKVVEVPGVADAVEISASMRTSCARRARGNVVCWGTATDGAVEAIADSADAAALFHTPRHACFVRKTGDALCERIVPRDGAPPAPAEPPAVIARDVMRVASTGEATCAVRRNGDVVCWGTDTFGEMGDGTRKGHDAPAPVIDLPKAKGISATVSSFCALTDDDSVRCWGANEGGQLGIGTDDEIKTPVKLPGVGPSARLAVGEVTTAAVENGQLRMWGLDMLGSGAPPGEGVPGLPEVTAATFSPQHACVITKAGGVSCWGSGYSLGVPLSAKHAPPSVKPIANVKNAVDVAAGGRHSCAVRADGRVLCWGHGLGLGLGKDKSSTAAIEVPGITDAVEVKAAFEYTCVRRKNGDVRCWGSLGSDVHPGIGAVAIGVGPDFGCALQRTGTVTCWKHWGTPPITDAIALGVADAQTCIVRKGGTVACFDYTKHVLRDVEGITDATSVAVATRHACAMTPSGPRCWGKNDSGRLPVPPPLSAKPVPIAW